MILFLLYIKMFPPDNPLTVYDDSHLTRWHRQLKGAGVGLSYSLLPIALWDLSQPAVLTQFIVRVCVCVQCCQISLMFDSPIIAQNPPKWIENSISNKQYKWIYK